MEILSVIQFSVLLYTHTSKSCDSLGDRLPVIQFSVVKLYTYTSKSSDAGGGQLSGIQVSVVISLPMHMDIH